MTDSAPTISQVTPAIGAAGTHLRIHGTHFRPGATVLLDTLTADSVVVVPDTLISAIVPAGVATTAGTNYVLTVRNADGSKGVKGSAFQVSAPVLQFLNGASEPSGAPGAPVVLQGQAFGG